jgi:hypothetical protein
MGRGRRGRRMHQSYRSGIKSNGYVATSVLIGDQGYVKGHIAMERRVLVLPKTEPFGFTKISEVRVNSRITGIQMCSPFL